MEVPEGTLGHTCELPAPPGYSQASGMKGIDCAGVTGVRGSRKPRFSELIFLMKAKCSLQTNPSGVKEGNVFTIFPGSSWMSVFPTLTVNLTL